MLKAKSGRRQAILYALLLAISLLLLAFSSSTPLTELRRGVSFALTPFQSVLRQGGQTASSFFGTLGEIDRLRQQNADLVNQVNDLAIKNQALESLRVQNEQLTDLLQVRSSLDYESAAAEVISRRISDQEHAVSLDRGTNAGIEVGDPVIGSGGALVGQVVDVGQNYSRVLLITDSRMNVVGLLESSRGVGTVHGQLDRPLEMDGIAASNTVNPGESVVTAGIELAEGIRSPYPKGLLIGSVADVQRSPDQLFQTALVNPAAQFDTLEYVLVITNYEGGLGPLEPTPAATP